MSSVSHAVYHEQSSSDSFAMDRPSPRSSLSASPRQRAELEDWEAWEDDDVVTPILEDEQVSIDQDKLLIVTTHVTQPPLPSRPAGPPSSRLSRNSSSKIRRLRSKQRQKAQNARAGIKLITDMAAFRRQNPASHQVHKHTPDGLPVKFVDVAALKALEGERNSASAGNWNWLDKKKNTQSPASAPPKSELRGARMPQLSTHGHPIVIGIALPLGDSTSTTTCDRPQTCRCDGSPEEKSASSRASEAAIPNQYTNLPPSVWSPDTPETASSFTSARPASSVYSQATVPGKPAGEAVPPVPSMPTTYKKTLQQKLMSLELGGAADESDSGTPCTLFEEDGAASPHNQARRVPSTLTPDSAGSRAHGWWDHVVTPFTDRRLTLPSRKQLFESAKEKAIPGRQEVQWRTQVTGEPCDPAQDREQQSRPPTPLQVSITPVPTSRREQSSSSDAEALQAPSSRSSSALSGSTLGEKPRPIPVNEVSADRPPPYSPPRTAPGVPVRYQAVFPPRHPLEAQFPPSPGPASPGLAATMTSQGDTQLADIPLGSPRHGARPNVQQPLPTRPVGSRLPQEHAYPARGPGHSGERRRRRHEKEDVFARRLGGFWRGRGCISPSGCFGRTGREGRKRRRVCVAIWACIIALMILVIVIAVVLTRAHHHEPVHSIWVNLTDFPPMPTGVLTVVGPDNTEARTICTDPSTAWSCSLPKGQHASVAPYMPDQPTIIMEIQWDNSSAASWNVPNGAPPVPISRRSLGGSACEANEDHQRRSIDGFNPNPAPPTFQGLWFMGETTDGIVSDQKAGEPTPFFISLLGSLNDTVALPRDLDTRGLHERDSTSVGGIPLDDILPQPDLLQDGTPAPAVMIPEPVQQPIRLYDRGLPSEHYSFYSHFRRTIFLKSVTALNSTASNVPLDEDGGCSKDEANFLVTWGQARVMVQIWTRLLSNTTSLIQADGQAGINGSLELTRPGTMPWPVTVTLDTHGGNPNEKITWEWPMDSRQHLNTSDAMLLENNMGAGGTWINPRGTGNAKYGGFDGGTGGCKCQWVNWS